MTTATYHYVKYTGRTSQPMLGDAPWLSPQGVRSANHDGLGQNVLDEDLSVHYRETSEQGPAGDNIYLNLEGEHAAGCNRTDIVLIRGDCGPEGPQAFAIVVGR